MPSTNAPDNNATVISGLRATTVLGIWAIASSDFANHADSNVPEFLTGSTITVATGAVSMTTSCSISMRAYGVESAAAGFAMGSTGSISTRSYGVEYSAWGTVGSLSNGRRANFAVSIDS